MKRFLLLAFVLLSYLVHSQEIYSIKGSITGFPGGMVYLSGYYGEFTPIFDSVAVTPDGNINFVMDHEKLPGYYRVVLGEEKYVDLIFNYEDIEFTTSFDHAFDSLQIIVSRENTIYYKFIKFLNDNQRELEILSPLTEIYPKSSILYPEIVARFVQVQKEREEYIGDIVNTYPDGYVTKVVKTQRTPYLSPEMTERERIEHLKLYYWDKVDLTDVSLLRSNVYPSLIIAYLGLHGNRNFSQEELEESFMSAVDIMLGASMDNEEVYAYFLEYLVNGFERYHFDKVLDHIATNYALEENCENENLDEEVVKRLKNYQNLSIGKPAPEIDFNNMAGSDTNLYSINNQYVLLVFWASWCPHCNELLPAIAALYETLTTDIEIVAISIDKNKTEYETALKEGYFPWINWCDYNGWNSKPAVDYNIYATPTMFLLDAEKTIIAKPITYNELITELSKL